MKKLSLLSLPVLALIGFTSCNPDTDPKIDTTKEYKFVLNTPQFATQFIDLSTRGTINFTVSQPDYGVTIKPVYNLEISLNEDFSPITNDPVEDSEGETHVVPGTYQLNLDGQEAGVLVAKMQDMASGINTLLGLFDQEMYEEVYPDGGGYYGPVYLKASSTLGDGKNATTTLSNVIKLNQVQSYAAFPSSEIKLCVPGGGNEWADQLWQLIYTGDTEDETAMIFKGFSYIKGAFKINDGDWADQVNWGASDDAEYTEGLKEEDGSYTGVLIQNTQSNFNEEGKAVPAGLYYIMLQVTDFKSTVDNTKVGTITLTPISKISIIGDFCGWNFDSAVEMTDDGDGVTYTASGSFTAAGWKFAMNDGWAINLGPNTDYEGEEEVKNPLIFDHGNIEIDASSVTLNLNQYPWTFTAN